jgi:hypothetical protein
MSQFDPERNSRDAVKGIDLAVRSGRRDDEARGPFLDRPWRREAAAGLDFGRHSEASGISTMPLRQEGVSHTGIS